MKEKEEPYKVELIEDLPEDAVISFYKQGEFTDLCAGPHLLSTKSVKAFKLTSLAGAYWRGSEKNKMLQRIYGTAFPKKAELEEYLNMLEEAKKRDHRKLGKRTGTLYDERRRTGIPVLPSKRNGTQKRSFGLLERDSQKSRICGDFNSGYVKPSSLGDIGTLGSLQREYVYNCDR